MTAYFVRRPDTIDDLIEPRLLGHELPFEIVKEVTLKKIEYENFIWDMFPEREFLLTGFGFCLSGDPMRCLLVRCRGAKDGVLVTTRRPELVEYAAYYRGEHDRKDA